MKCELKFGNIELVPETEEEKAFLFKLYKKESAIRLKSTTLQGTQTYGDKAENLQRLTLKVFDVKDIFMDRLDAYAELCEMFNKHPNISPQDWELIIIEAKKLGKSE